MGIEPKRWELGAGWVSHLLCFLVHVAGMPRRSSSNFTATSLAALSSSKPSICSSRATVSLRALSSALRRECTRVHRSAPPFVAIFEPKHQTRTPLYLSAVRVRYVLHTGRFAKLFYNINYDCGGSITAQKSETIHEFYQQKHPQHIFCVFCGIICTPVDSYARCALWCTPVISWHLVSIRVHTPVCLTVVVTHLLAWPRTGLRLRSEETARYLTQSYAIAVKPLAFLFGETFSKLSLSRFSEIRNRRRP